MLLRGWANIGKKREILPKGPVIGRMRENQMKLLQKAAKSCGFAAFFYVEWAYRKNLFVHIPGFCQKTGEFDKEVLYTAKHSRKRSDFQ